MDETVSNECEWVYVVVERDWEDVSVVAVYRNLESAKSWRKSDEWILDERDELEIRWYNRSCNFEIRRTTIE